MKSNVIINAVDLQSYAFDCIFEGKSAFEKVLDWAMKTSDSGNIFVLLSSKETQNCQFTASIEKYQKIKPLTLLCYDDWNRCTLFAHLAECTEEDVPLVYAFGDTPFLDTAITNQILQQHDEFKGEYSFADGYPVGISPEVLDKGLVSILKNLVTQDERYTPIPLTRESIFDTLKVEINSYEIETVIAPYDYRYLRFTFACDRQLHQNLCKKAFDLSLQQENAGRPIYDLAKENTDCLAPLPAYYSIQIASYCGGKCTYCPYPREYEKKMGHNPCFAKEKNPQCFMLLENYKELITKISDYSKEAYICLSHFGEATMHPQLKDIIALSLQYPKLQLVIETTGEGLSEKLVEELVSVAASYEKGLERLIWIVSLDAFDEEKYKELHGDNQSLGKAVALLEYLQKYFSVYAQFIRMNENEAQLENFYRYWKEKNCVLIQKYDSFCGLLPQRKVTDLAPVIRNPCWHLRRDMNILVDGDVTLCKSACLSAVIGNALKEELPAIFAKQKEIINLHLNNQYKDLCKDCDEYYTFNF